MDRDQSLGEAIDAVLGGDVEAFEPIVAAYQDAIQAYMLCRAPSPALADDLTQTCFVTAFERLSTFRREEPFGPWLYGIGRNLLRQAWDRAGRDVRNRESLEAFVQQQLGERGAEEEPGRVADRLGALAGCLEELPERWGQLVSMHYKQGRKLAEIAAALGNAPSTVGVTLHRVRKKLRECIDRRLAAEGA